jgi:hypothetical protein
MDPNRYRIFDPLLTGLCCILSACSAYFAVCWLGDVFHWVSNPYDANSAFIGVGMLSLIGVVGSSFKRIGLISLLSAIPLVLYCFWTLSLGHRDPIKTFVPVILCLGLMPLLNAILLRLTLYALVPNYDREPAAASLSDMGHSFAAMPMSGGLCGPAGTLAPTPPIMSPGSSFQSSNENENDVDAKAGDQA